MYSQNDEEKHIENFFGTTRGSFLDIGAYDGKKFSNTHRLMELGWSGICVEPSPSVFVSLMKNTEKFRDVLKINAAIALESKMMLFFDSGGDAISSFNTQHVKKWESGFGSKFANFFIKTITMKEIFDSFGTDFSFINLDVEAYNVELFNVLCEYILGGKLQKLKLICVEHDGQYENMISKLSQCGFKKIALNGENLILGR